jgi:hypothetical protein
MAAESKLARLGRRLRRGAERDAMPLADAAALLPVARRTRVVRFGLAAALAAAALAAFVVAPEPEGRRFLPSGTVGIVVLDLSSSIRPDEFTLIRLQLEALASSDRRFGVVLFSDVAYEALPPGTPARELRPFVRFFDPGRLGNTQEGLFARTPWEQWFSAGTAISPGLLLAAELLERHHVENGSVVLISDLADDTSDLPRLADTLALYSERQIPLRIVALDPTPENRELFRELIGNPGSVEEVELPEGERGRGTIAVEAPFSTWLAVLAGLVVVVLAANELWAEPLRWSKRAGA